MVIIDNVTGLPIPEIVLLKPINLLIESIEYVSESVIHTNRGNSTRAKIRLFSKGDTFYNAANTSKDKLAIAGKLLNMSNINAWSLLTGINIQSRPKCPNVNCKAQNPYDLVGAHVVIDPKKTNVQSGDTLYLIPICRSCNGRNAPIVLGTDLPALVLTI